MSAPRVITRAVLTLELAGIPLAVADPVAYGSRSTNQIWVADGHRSHFHAASETPNVFFGDEAPLAAVINGAKKDSLSKDGISPHYPEETAGARTLGYSQYKNVETTREAVLLANRSPSLTATAMPEPSSWTFGLAALFAIGGALRWRQRTRPSEHGASSLDGAKLFGAPLTRMVQQY